MLSWFVLLFWCCQASAQSFLTLTVGIKGTSWVCLLSMGDHLVGNYRSLSWFFLCHLKDRVMQGFTVSVVAGRSASLKSRLWTGDSSAQGFVTTKDLSAGWSGLRSGFWGSLKCQISLSLILWLGRAEFSCLFCIVFVGGSGQQAFLAPNLGVYGI